eukprot:CAMPEP_0168620678 /NCGR_PEP_ID=MMETSP0449_2-20121227/7278_1 /TAXON_ID=1082188 /ORGANISM="Strombidium rassoulzadegani, Strain ras09" /LENGTH=81 /DNA_ID=CAMNT_0008661725 /DNA_START=138 /DNA_END=383 /DNA_ORIENTATION=+
MIYRSGREKSIFTKIDGKSFASQEVVDFMFTDWVYLMYKITVYLQILTLLSFPLPNFLPIALYYFKEYEIERFLEDSSILY